MGYDTINLRHSADFEVRLAKDVFWVPFNRLGKSRFTNEELGQIVKTHSARQIRELQLNVYEAVQLFQSVLRFRECNDIERRHYDGMEWELHKSGRYAYETNEGCCASAAAWMNYVVGKTYPQRGYLHIIRPDGSGHILNWIFTQKRYFIMDMAALTCENALQAPKETGLLQDYLAAQLYMGVCIAASDLQSFVEYHRRIPLRKGYEFNYLVTDPDHALPPCVSYEENGVFFYQEMGKSEILRMNKFWYRSRAKKESAVFPAGYTNRYR